MEREGMLMSSMPPNEKNNPKKPLPEPFRELVKSMNDFFTDKPVRGFLQSIDDFFNTPFPAAAGFPVKTIETGNEHIITAELPGVKREQIHLNITGNYLTISVENNELETEEDNHNQVFRSKFIRQQSSRTISLPHAINDKKVKASYRDGLLQICIPQEKGKIIEIEE
ncbi:Hsp20/alpha crystallin family protein [Neobacillus vireti]|uniref:Heat shock protein Hsp20 n=1 Tax=Neobacillus vireti LMG 21834 TaxID=1131730 RepID=A0AB94ISU7_9BACI|nr:Hsp20/alpha crystallin family protein [Neobacillus vireti]ETI70028.1 heat shock protein Hsp20 [Neobacillus vireti LMG 21834]